MAWFSCCCRRPQICYCLKSIEVHLIGTCWRLSELRARAEGPTGILYDGPIDPFTEYRFPTTRNGIPGNLVIRADAPEQVCQSGITYFANRMKYDFPPDFVVDTNVASAFQSTLLSDSAGTGTGNNPGDPDWLIMRIYWTYVPTLGSSRWVEIENGILERYVLQNGYTLMLRVSLPERFCGSFDNPLNTLRIWYTLNNGSPPLTRLDVFADGVLGLTEVINPYTPGTEIYREGELDHAPNDLNGIYNVTRQQFGLPVSIFAVRWKYAACNFKIEYPTPYSNTATPPTFGFDWRIENSLAVSIPATITDGVSPYTCSVAAGSLPPGCRITAATGLISDIVPTLGPSTTGICIIKCIDSDANEAFTNTINWEYIGE